MNELEMMEKIEMFFDNELRICKKAYDNDYDEFIVNRCTMSFRAEEEFASELNEALTEISVIQRMKRKLIASLKEGE